MKKIKCMEEFEVGAIQKRDDVKIRVCLKMCDQNFNIDIREYLETERYSGPTRKGIFFSTEDWNAFFELMRRLDETVKTRA